MPRALSVLLCTALAVGCAPEKSDRDGAGPGGNEADAGPGGGGGGGGCTSPSCLNECPDGQQTTLRGVVTAPNGIDPVPGAAVYVPRGSVTEFPTTVRCEVCDQLADQAVVSAQTEVDGSFVLGPIPTGENQEPGAEITIVTQMGRFRRMEQVVVDNPCDENMGSNEQFRLPGRNEGISKSIPNIAVVTGAYDAMECVLLKLGIEQDQFELFEGSVPLLGDAKALLEDLDKMKTYNIIFINCGTTFDIEGLLANAAVRQNIQDYVESGGRLYATDLSYDYVEQIPAFAPLIDFEPDASDAAPETQNAAELGTGDIEVSASVDQAALGDWLRAVEAATGDEVISDDGTVFVEHFLGGWAQQREVPPADEVTVWLSGDADGERPLTTTFDYQQCGRVLYSSYHTLGRAEGLGFPNYCQSGPLSPQERVLEYLIFHIADCIDPIE